MPISNLNKLREAQTASSQLVSQSNILSLDKSIEKVYKSTPNEFTRALANFVCLLCLPKEKK